MQGFYDECKRRYNIKYLGEKKVPRRKRHLLDTKPRALVSCQDAQVFTTQMNCTYTDITEQWYRKILEGTRFRSFRVSVFRSLGCGSSSATFSIACLCAPSLMRRSCACMATWLNLCPAMQQCSIAALQSASLQGGISPEITTPDQIKRLVRLENGLRDLEFEWN